MAYVDQTSVGFNEIDAAASTYTPPIPGNIAGDLIVYFLAQDGGGTTISTASTGWTVAGTQAASGGCRGVFAYKYTSTGNEAAPTFSGASDEWLSTFFIVKDADASTPVYDAIRADYNNVQTFQSPSGTATNNDTLILQGACTDGIRAMIGSNAESVPVYMGIGTSACSAVSYRNQRTSGALTQITYIHDVATEGGNAWALLINNKTNGAFGPDQSPVQTQVNLYNYATSTTWANANSIAATINSINTDTSAVAAAAANVGNQPWGAFTGLNCTVASVWGGGTDVLAAPINLADKVLSFMWSITATIRVASEGVIIVFGDASGNWSAFQIVRKTQLAAQATAYLFSLSPSTQTPYASNGTLDVTAITKISYLYHRTAATTGSSLQVSRLVYYTPTDKLLGGSSASPVNAAAMNNAYVGWGAKLRVSFQGLGQLLDRYSVSFGDGSTPTYVDFNGNSVELPSPYSVAKNQVAWNVGSNLTGFTVHACSACTMNFRNCLMITGEKAFFTIAAGSSTSASYDFSGSFWSGWAVTWKTGVPCSGAIFRSCYGVDGKAATFTNVTFRNPLDGFLLKLDDGGDALSCVFTTETAADYAIRIPAAGTYDLSGSTFGGFTKPIDVTASSGTVTIVLATDDDVPAYDTDGATVVFQQTVITAAVSISGMPTDGNSIRLQIANESGAAAAEWDATTAYTAGQKVRRTTGIGSENTRGLYFQCSTAGTTGGSEPTWDTTPGNTTSDGSVVWTCYSVLYYDDDPAAATYSASYDDGTYFCSGDAYSVHFAELNGSTSFKLADNDGIATSAGFTVALEPVANAVYASNAVDGSDAAVESKFTINYTDDHIVLDNNEDFALAEAFAYYCYQLTLSQGMAAFWDAVTAIDAGNYRNNTAQASIFFDETDGFVKQTDSARWFRDDGARPALDPTTGGAGLEINWRNPVFIAETGVSGLTPTEAAQLAKVDTLVVTDGLVLADVQAMNGAGVIGTGTVGDAWRGVGVSPS